MAMYSTEGANWTAGDGSQHLEPRISGNSGVGSVDVWNPDLDHSPLTRLVVLMSLDRYISDNAIKVRGYGNYCKYTILLTFWCSFSACQTTASSTMSRLQVGTMLDYVLLVGCQLTSYLLSLLCEIS